MTLGRQGIERMRRAREREQAETRAQHDALKLRMEDVHAWLDSGQKGGLSDTALPDRSAELPRLPKLQKDFEVVCETIQLLTTPERETRLKKLKEHEERKNALVGQVAILKERQTNFNLRARPHEDGLAAAAAKLQEAKLAMTEKRVHLPPGILDADLNARLQAALAESSKWEERLESVLRHEAEAREAANNARNARNNERLALATARDSQGNVRHPEYQTDFPPEDESNEAWAARLRLLETVELEKSRALAAERRQGLGAPPARGRAGSLERKNPGRRPDCQTTPPRTLTGASVSTFIGLASAANPRLARCGICSTRDLLPRIHWFKASSPTKSPAPRRS